MSIGGIRRVDRGNMSRYQINRGQNGDRMVFADYFKLEGQYFWFFDSDGNVKHITKATYVETIDLI